MMVAGVNGQNMQARPIARQGADSVSVRLAVTEAMRCYTGLGADRIVIYKMNE